MTLCHYNGAFRFNRNIVECKASAPHHNTMPSPLVLIETLWNVKEDQNEFHEMLVEVLIETLWNVKLRRPAILAPVLQRF